MGINIFRPGDKVLIADYKTLVPTREYTVERSVLLSEKKIQVFVKEKLGDFPEECVAENLSTAPDIHILRCETGNNRPRGFLLATRGKTLVEECVFYNMYAGVVAGCEMQGWYESGPFADITIRNCDFRNCAYAGDYAIRLVPNICDPENAGSFNGKALIEGNTFTMHEKHFVVARNLKELCFRNNRYIFDASLPSHPGRDDRGVIVFSCEKTFVEEI